MQFTANTDADNTTKIYGYNRGASYLEIIILCNINCWLGDICRCPCAFVRMPTLPSKLSWTHIPERASSFFSCTVPSTTSSYDKYRQAAWQSDEIKSISD